MPSNVSWFEKLMYGSLALGLAVMLLDGARVVAKPEVQQMGGLPFIFTVGLFVLAIMALLVWLTARRRMNWARWVIAIFFVLGMFGFVPQLLETISANLAAGLLNITQALMQAAALFFVFTGNARPWFQKAQPTT